MCEGAIKMNLTQKELNQDLEGSLEVALRCVQSSDKDRPNIIIYNTDSLDFDIDAVIADFATKNNVQLIILNVATLVPENIKNLRKALNEPSIVLMKNFDSESSPMREYLHVLVKDCSLPNEYGTSIFINNFLFAIATTADNKPLQDMGERSCFRSFFIDN